MRYADLKHIKLHCRKNGDPDRPALVFSNSLGTNLRLWDAILPYLPKNFRIIRYDKRGHGLSEYHSGLYSMGALIRDAEVLLDHLNVSNCVFVGLSIGSMTAQGLAAKRSDLVHALVLSNTGEKIGTSQLWHDRIKAVEQGEIKALASAIMQRWFSPEFRATAQLDLWSNVLLRQPREDYIGCSAAIAGSEDGSAPPDLVGETINLISSAQFQLIKKAGHLPCIEQPEVYAKILLQFLQDVGYATDNRPNDTSFAYPSTRRRMPISATRAKLRDHKKRCPFIAAYKKPRGAGSRKVSTHE